MSRFPTTLTALALALVAVPPLAAQQLPILPSRPACGSEMEARLAFGLCPDGTFDFLAGGSYRAGVPTPAEQFGYPLGSWHTTYGRMERYLDTLARALPERVRVFDYGQSVERQTMHLVAISSESNLARLDAIRSELQRLADPRGTTAAQAEELAARLPIAVWINAANDGNETAAFEAAIQVAYQMAAGEDARTRALREGSVVLVNLAHNPESHERAVSWLNAFVAADPDPLGLEHNAPWGMNNNNNHYQFDLNRDALGLVQSESRAVAYELRRWRPQVFADLHGQTTQYFFPPAADPINPLYPGSVERWLEVFGRSNAAAFDRFGWEYYTRDVFDLFYPGYWDTYPTLHGATGMTYETDGGGVKSVRWRRDDGTILTFADGIAKHFVASMATIEAAVQHRQARLRDFRAFFADAIRPAGDARSVVLLPGDDPERLARLTTTLLRHGLEVSRVGRAGTVVLNDFATGRRERRSIPTGAVLVDLAQPSGVLARTLLALDVPVPDRFREQELARYTRNLLRSEGEREAHAFYDVTAWNLALAMGVPGGWSADLPALALERLAPLSEAQAKAPGGWEGDVAGARTGGVTGRARSAYLWRAGGLASTRLLARLLDEGFNVAVSEVELVAGDSTLPRGALIARVGRNPAALHERIQALAADAGVTVLAVQTGYQETGPSGIGGERTRSLRAPRIGVVAGEGTRVDSYGALWFYLERRLGQPFTAIRTSDLGDARLDDFDVLVFPDGRGYARVVSEETTGRIREWVRRGGALVAYGSGASLMQSRDLGARYEAPDTARLPADSLAALLRPTADAVARDPTGPPTASPRARPDEPLAVPGAILRARLDRGHWLTTGYQEPMLPVLARSLPLRRSLEGANALTYAPASELVATGFVWPGNTAASYPGRPYATVDRVGDGQVVLLAEDPLFRGTYDAPAQLLWNAIYLGARGR